MQAGHVAVMVPVPLSVSSMPPALLSSQQQAPQQQVQQQAPQQQVQQQVQQQAPQQQVQQQVQQQGGSGLGSGREEAGEHERSGEYSEIASV